MLILVIVEKVRQFCTTYYLAYAIFVLENTVNLVVVIHLSYTFPAADIRMATA